MHRHHTFYGYSKKQSPGSAIRNPNSNKISEECVHSYGSYHGPKYSLPGVTVIEESTNNQCILESKWMRVMQHAVRLTPTSSIIPDWLWIDYHDRINVLVEEPRDSNHNEARWLVFRQTKYALEGRMSLAVIGGIIERGETAEVAARREVAEEMGGGMNCDKLVSLGRFRTDVNRGMGWVNSFVAMDCIRGGNVGEKEKSTEAGEDEVGAADTEKQDQVALNLEELREAVREGKFLEVQWSNTVALALLHPDVLQR
eukprot:CAMPEP_0195519988 /NCGR_PEP_ID=MMETSP0794_2-20130614/15882_1 /TAXON_ID=515487 /ORGANISM="Stephanopyxis turris, Strain CCMP 815" /LENGTH=255 /DNA_ID=CAMNT_0040649249 /DNA_START=175 /DNA_END=942 /DNA_ORIENTATION=-